jgi:hypothetical protein
MNEEQVQDSGRYPKQQLPPGTKKMLHTSVNTAAMGLAKSAFTAGLCWMIQVLALPAVPGVPRPFRLNR